MVVCVLRFSRRLCLVPVLLVLMSVDLLWCAEEGGHVGRLIWQSVRGRERRSVSLLGEARGLLLGVVCKGP